jgi:hypothetical protein
MTEKSQNGWTASKDPNEIHIKSFAVAGTGINLRCQATAGVILAAFAVEFNATVERLEGATLDDWGYAYRPVRGQTTGLSNHASGTAIDLNSIKHPLGKKHTFTGPQEVILKALVKKYGLRWGGSYTSRTDEMHFEIIETPAQVKLRINKLGLNA